MKVCQFNTFSYGGAANAARRLHDGLRSQGIDSQFYFWKNNEQELDDSYHQLAFPQPCPQGLLAPFIRQRSKIRQRKIKRRYDRHIRPRPRDLEVFSAARLLDETRLCWDHISADIVQLHWTAFFLDYPSFFGSIPDHVPLVWTLHDMNPMTGGCHYSSGCSRFTVGCGSCPQLIQSHRHDESDHSFRAKQKALRKKTLTIVAPSQWMLDLAHSSQLFPEKTRFELIRYGLDLQVYKPVKPTIARRQLGIEVDAGQIILGFGAEDINHQRKGFHLLVQALRQLKASANIKCLVFGAGKLPAHLSELPEICSVGFVDAPRRQALVYSAMDFFVMPSLEDNSPQTGLEALACGTPVVAFRAGGVPEYVVPGQTGLLCEAGDARQLRSAIVQLANNRPAISEMSRRGRQLIEQRYRDELQTGNYIDLYHELLNYDQLPTAESQPELRKCA